MDVFLSVLFRHNHTTAPIVAHVLRVTVNTDDTLSWVKHHADEIAFRHFKRNDYIALHVSKTDELTAAAEKGA